MSKQKAVYKPQVLCPSCGNASNIDYCSPGVQYTWWCSNDDCGRQYRFTINEDWSVESEPTGVVVTRTKVTLKIKKVDDDIFVTIKGRKINGEHNDRYYYEEHTCPVNLFRDGIEVRVGEDTDPHGIFQYVKTEELSEGE